MSFLSFKTIDSSAAEKLKPYIYEYGEGSCTWSVVHTYKYRDSYAIEDDILIILRDHLCDEHMRVYTTPLCSPAQIPAAMELIERDAVEHGTDFRLFNVTARVAGIIESSFPGRYSILPDRDYAEYIYRTQDLANLAGGKYSAKRNLIKNFMAEHEGKLTIKPFGKLEGLCREYLEQQDMLEPCRTAEETGELIGKLLKYQDKWVEERKKLETYGELVLEGERIYDMLQHYAELEISGTAILIDNEVAGYAFGAPNNASCYDIIAEKGDVTAKGIYQTLNRELARLISGKYEYMNMEEDVGLEGLRHSKNSYHPAYLLEKYNLFQNR